MEKHSLAVQINIAAFKHGLDGAADRKKYLEALINEINSASDYSEEFAVNNMLITGPNTMQYPVDALTDVIDTLKNTLGFQRNPEITVAALPGSVTYAEIHALHEHQVNRISFDMGSFVQTELDALGRNYSRSAMEVFMRMVQLKMVFFNYDITLYYGIPGQTADSLIYSIEQAIKYMGMHITLLPHKHKVDCIETSDLYRKAMNMIKMTSYEQYTPIHFCRHGYASQWNKQTYSIQPRLGFGIDAISMIDGVVARNTADIINYTNANGDPSEIITSMEPITQPHLEANAILDKLFNFETYELPLIDPEINKRIDILDDQGLVSFEGKTLQLSDTGKANWSKVARMLTS